MKYLIAAILMSLSLVSAAPKGPASEPTYEIFPTAEAGTCTPKYGPCNPYVRPNTTCCSAACKATAPAHGVCM